MLKISTSSSRCKEQQRLLPVQHAHNNVHSSVSVDINILWQHSNAYTELARQESPRIQRFRSSLGYCSQVCCSSQAQTKQTCSFKIGRSALETFCFSNKAQFTLTTSLLLQTWPSRHSESDKTEGLSHVSGAVRCRAQCMISVPLKRPRV